MCLTPLKVQQPVLKHSVWDPPLLTTLFHPLLLLLRTKEERRWFSPGMPTSPCPAPAPAPALATQAPVPACPLNNAFPGEGPPPLTHQHPKRCPLRPRALWQAEAPMSPAVCQGVALCPTQALQRVLPHVLPQVLP